MYSNLVKSESMLALSSSLILTHIWAIWIHINKVVVVIGSMASAHDIAEDIAKVAKEVHLSSRSSGIEISKLTQNMWQHSKIEYCYENGEIAFEDGALVAADIILHCTGYKYDFPFLKTNGIITIEDNRVGPLYKHVFPPQLAPTLSFVGIPHLVVNFLMIELQAKWVASVLSGKTILPSKEEMLSDVEQYYRLMEAKGVPKHHTHTLLMMNMNEHLDWVAAQVGIQVDKQQKEIFWDVVKEIRTSWLGYRDKLTGTWNQ
ncbi:hypothetical protein ACH5RR_000359 [Cinchona calisaya]|uniref:Flavin-containing monooxygenase n=1 Tax=Cinchona calisaya TaxID=153742 RepID=A0ABD3B0I7_9GENT